MATVYRETDAGLEKRCPHCAQWKLAEGGFVRYAKPLKSGATRYGSWCKACVAVKQASYHKQTWGPERLAFSAHKRSHTVRAYLAYLRAKAVARRGDSVTVEQLEALWRAQEGRCALTGWPMTRELGRGVVATNASIDRIDSARGYEPGSIQLVCRAANTAKNALSPAEFLALCRAVVENAHVENASVAA